MPPAHWYLPLSLLGRTDRGNIWVGVVTSGMGVADGADGNKLFGCNIKGLKLWKFFHFFVCLSGCILGFYVSVSSPRR